MSRPSVLVLAAAVVLFSGCGGSQSLVLPEATNAPASESTWIYELPPDPSYERAIANATRTPEGAPGPAYWTQYTGYTIRARLFPEEHRLEGSGHYVYQNRSPNALPELHLELSLNLHAPGVVRNETVPPANPVQLLRVQVDGVALPEAADGGSRFTVNGTRLIVVPPGPVGAGRTVDIEIEWALDIPWNGAGGRMGHHNDELFFLAYWYPTMSVYDDVEGWHTDPFRGNAEFYHGFGDYDVTITAPADWVLHATGVLENEAEVLAPAIRQRLRDARGSDLPVRVLDEADFGKATIPQPDSLVSWHFRAEQVNDFTFSATRHSIWDAARASVGDLNGDGQTDYTLVNALYRSNAPLWRNVVGYGQHAIQFFSESTGLSYPWPHVTAVEGTPIETGGMEFPMLTLIGNYNSRGDSALYAVVAHELFHLWIPMIVAPNERRYGWMDEGLTTFSENAAKRDRDPEAMHRLMELYQYILTARQGLESEIMTWSDFHHPPQSTVVAVYFKPSTVFEALRGVLGDETFFRAYRTFIQEWAYKHPYPRDFFATFERVAERDLDWFWQSWFFETWQLDQAIDSVSQSDGILDVTISNKGRIPMPVHLEVELQDGTTLRRTYDVEDLWVRSSGPARLQLPISGPAIRVEIDPELFFPDVERNNNVWWLREPAP